MKHEWLTYGPSDVTTLKNQLVEEGKDVSPLAAEFDSLLMEDQSDSVRFQDRFLALLDQGESLPEKTGHPYEEPSDLEGIRGCRPPGPRRFEGGVDWSRLADRVHAAWLGRCSGNLLGKPVEGWHVEKIWGFLKDLGKFPLRNYFRSDVSPAILEKYEIDPSGPFVNRVSCAVEDDDLNYTVAGLALLKVHGPDFAPVDVARFWLDRIPILRTFTAERVAYRNLIEGIDPPRSASLRNPYREWIGAQIRADFWGYAAMGCPERAAEFAWRDASISHTRNGIYGEMWVAAMLAAAPFVADMQELIEVGLSEIPAQCRLAEGLRSVLSWWKEGISYDQAVRRIHLRWDEKQMHAWCHTLSNAQIVAIGLLWGEGSFEKSICRAVQAGFDTDCNGATVGSIFGMTKGTQALPTKWSAPLNDRLETGVMGYLSTPISGLAEEGFQVYRSIISTS